MTYHNRQQRTALHINPPLVERWLRFRDRLLTNPNFLRWIERFPLTRPVARSKASQLFDLCSGFVYSQILFACVQLNVFHLLKDQPHTPFSLAEKLGLNEQAALRLLGAATALGLLEKRPSGFYGLGQLGAAVIANPGLAAMVEHHALLYRDLADPVALLKDRRTTNTSSFWPYAKDGISDGDVNGYTQLMAATQPALAQEILRAYDFSSHRRVMDVGGGNGAFLTHAARYASNIEFMLFDLPDVVEIARNALTKDGLVHRVSLHSGSFLTDPLPQGADLITLVRVILDHDDKSALAILERVRKALPVDGVLLIAEAMAETKAAPKVEAYFTFYLMAMGRGRPRTEAELRALLQKAGFSQISSLPTCQPLLTRILLARI